MTVLFQQDNDNGTHGNVLTEGLTGYDGMTGTDPVYDNTWYAAGSLCAKYDLAGVYSHQTKTITGATSTYWRRYFKWGVPSSNSAIVGIYDTNSVAMGSVRALTDGTIQLRSATNVEIDVSTHVFANGDEVRVEYHPVVGGTSEVRLFWGTNVHGTTPDETLTGSNGTAGTGTITQVREGMLSSTTVLMYADETEIDNASWPGPVASAPVILAASGTVAAYGNASGNATTAVEVATPSLTLQMFVGAALATNGSGLLTSAARWQWGGFGYAYPGGSFVPEGGGMRCTWSTSPTQPGNGVQAALFTADTSPLIPGHRIKVKIVVNVPVGSPDVSIVNAFTSEGQVCTVKDRDVELTLFLTWSAERNPMFGIQSLTNGVAGSVLVKRVTFVDVSTGAGEWYPSGGTVLPPPPPVDTEDPTTPGTPTATVTGYNVALSWTASTDNVAVTSYEVHRSASSGFTPSAGTKVTNAPSNTWTDIGVAAGTYYYKVIATDAAGNTSAASGQATATVSDPVTPTLILSGVSVQQDFGGRTDWDGYRAYTSGRLYDIANQVGTNAGQNRPEFIAYSKQGAPFSGSYASIFATCLADLNAFYYTSSTGQTHSSRWGIKLYWSNGNENYDKGMLSGGATSAANVALYVESQRALYDACHYIDPTTGQRRFPDAYAGTNPTHYAELNGDVEVWLHPSVRYMDFVMWSMYPPGREDTATDPTYNWPSLDPDDWDSNPLGFFLRCFRRTSLARAQARIDTGNPNFELDITVGEIGIASDPDDSTHRPYYAVYGWFGAWAALASQYAINMPWACYWDNQLTGSSHGRLSDEPPNSDHGGDNGSSTSPSTAAAFKNWASYHTDHGGTRPGAWSTNPKGSWKFTGTQV